MTIEEFLIPLDFLVRNGKPYGRGCTLNVMDLLTILQRYHPEVLGEILVEHCEYLVDSGEMYVDDDQYKFI